MYWRDRCLVIVTSFARFITAMMLPSWTTRHLLAGMCSAQGFDSESKDIVERANQCRGDLLPAGGSFTAPATSTPSRHPVDTQSTRWLP